MLTESVSDHWVLCRPRAARSLQKCFHLARLLLSMKTGLWGAKRGKRSTLFSIVVEQVVVECVVRVGRVSVATRQLVQVQLYRR
jgi:hypothetical protein